MAHLYKKVIKGGTYWYLREVVRIDGKVSVKWQKYLGTTAALLEKLGESGVQSKGKSKNKPARSGKSRT